MTTFFCFVGKLNAEILSYYSYAEARLEKEEDGFRFTNAEVRAEVTLQQEELAGKAREIGGLAEKHCLVSRSVACPAHYELEAKTIGK